MMLVDSHCHLNFPQFADDLEGVIARAKVAGVGVLQTICTKLEDFSHLLAITGQFADVYCSVGVHPNHEEEKAFSAEDIIGHCSHEKVIGIGETGLDYYRDFDKAIQVKHLTEHIVAAQETGLPLIVHARDADEDVASILSEHMKKKPFKGLIHCFTSGPYLADAALEMGFCISFSGILTFKNATQIQEIAKNIPADRILVETDAPYLAPVPYRGKGNEPAYVIYTNRMLAQLRGMSEEACATASTDNFFRLFAKANRPAAEVAA